MKVHRVRVRVVVAACAALAALWAARAAWRERERAGSSAELATRRVFLRQPPHELAHRLSDFSTLPHKPRAAPDPGSWRVEEERGNFTSWRYRVRWACGARCAGEAAYLTTGYTGAERPAHAHAARHRLTLHVRVCIDNLCDEMEILAEISPDGEGGVLLSEHARASCGLLQQEAGKAASETCSAVLREHRALHHARLAQLA